MRIGYARTSTEDQKAGFEAQLDELSALGCTKIFKEQISSVAKRPQLEAALDFIREGDTLVVTKLDRLARSMRELFRIVDRIADKGADLYIIATGIDTGTPAGKLVLHVFGALAEFERTNMLERQRAGIAKAKREGKYKGRAPVSQEKIAEAEALLAGGMPKARVAREVGVGRSTLYRAIDERMANGKAAS